MTRRPELRFGAVVPTTAGRRYVEGAESLETLSSLWCGGHILASNGAGEAIVRLASVVACTDRVEVGSAILLLPLYHPVTIARQLSDLQVRSHGRLAVGVGVGGEVPAEFDALGVPLGERGRRTDEALHILRALWSDTAVSHDGEFFSFDNVHLRPIAPIDGEVGDEASYPPPIYISGRKPPAIRRAALLGDGFMPYMISSRRYREASEQIRSLGSEHGRDLADFQWLSYNYFCIGETREDAYDDAARFLGEAYGQVPREVVDRVVAVGTVVDVVAQLQSYVDAGVRHLILAPASTGDTLAMLRVAHAEVLPALAANEASR